MSNGLDPDQDGHSVGPYLCPNCLQKVISRRQMSPLARKELKLFLFIIQLQVRDFYAKIDPLLENQSIYLRISSINHIV